MPLGPCLEKSPLDDDDKAYLQSESDRHQKNGLSPADADRKAVMDFRHKTQDSLADMFRQLKIDGFEKKAEPKVKVIKKRKPAKLSKVREDASQIDDLTDPRSVALQYLAKGGKVHPDSVTKLLGKGEVQQRLQYAQKTGPTIDRLAEDMWREQNSRKSIHDTDEGHPEHKFKEAIEAVVREHVSPESAAKELLDVQSKNNTEVALTDEEYQEISDRQLAALHKHAEGLDEESTKAIVKLLEKYQDKNSLVDWEKLKEDSGGFDADFLNLSEKTQKELNAIIDRNTAEPDEHNNVAGENGSGEKTQEEENGNGSGNNSTSGRGLPETTSGELPKLDDYAQRKKAAQNEYDRLNRALKTAEDKIAATQSKQTGIGEAQQGGMFSVGGDEAKEILDPLRKKVKEAKAELDKINAERTSDKNQGSLFKAGKDETNPDGSKVVEHVTPAEVFEAVRAAHPDDELLNATADFLEPIFKDKDTKIENTPGLTLSDGRPALGVSRPDGTIAVDFDAFHSAEAAHRIVLHEMMHEATRYEIENNSALRGELDDALNDVRDAMGLPTGDVSNTLLPALADNGIIPFDKYGPSNAHELVSELWTNQRFYDTLKGIKRNGESVLKMLVNKILGAFSKKYKALNELKKGITADNMADYVIELTKKHFSDLDNLRKAEAKEANGGELPALKPGDPTDQKYIQELKAHIKTAPNFLTDAELKEMLMKKTRFDEDDIDRFILNDRNSTPEAKFAQNVKEQLKDKKTLAEKQKAASKLTDQEKEDIKKADDALKLSDQEKADIKRSNKAARKHGAVSLAQEAIVGAKKVAHAVADTWLNVQKWTNYNDAVGKWSDAKQQNDKLVMDMIKKIKEAVPDKRRREAISNYIEAAGDMKVLKERADKSEGENLRHKAGYILAQKLAPDDIAIAKQVSDYFDSMFKLGEKNGLLKSQLMDYISHIGVKKNDAAAVTSLINDIDAGKLNTNFKYARRRVFDTFFDLEQAGYSAKTKDAAHIMAIYSETFAKSAYSRGFVRDMTNGVASDGRPLLAHAGGSQDILNPNYPLVGTPTEATLVDAFRKSAEDEGYQPLDHFAMRDWVWATTNKDGKPVYQKVNLLVHPEIYKDLKNILGKSAIRDNWAGRTLLSGSGLIKKAIFSLSPFFHYDQIGLHGIGHLTNPVTHLPPINFNDPKQAKLSRTGLLLFSSDAHASFREGLGSGDFWKKIPVARELVKMQDFLFKEYIPRLKMKTALHALERNLERNAKAIASGKISEDAVYAQTSRQMNAAYGNLNYDLIGRNKSAQDMFRIFAIAPDFLEARAKFVGQALTKTGTEQLRAIFTLAGIQYVAARIVNKTIDDDYHWDEPFAIVHNGKKYTARTVPTDLWELSHDPQRFIYNRLAPIGQAGYEVFGRYDPVRGRAVDFPTAMKDLLTSGVPQLAKDYVLPESYSKFPQKPPDEKMWNAVINLFGARQREYMSPMEETIMQQFYKRNPKGEPTDASRDERKIYQAHEAGDDDKVEELIDQLPAPRQKAMRERLARGKDKSLAMFQRLPPEDKIRLFKQMSDEEKDKYDPQGKVQRLVDGQDE